MPAIVLEVGATFIDDAAALVHGAGRILVKLVMAPERTIQGQALRELVELPQVVGGLDEASLRAGVEFFGGLAHTVVPVSGLEAAELVKLSNNCHTDLIYSFGNELALIAEEHGLDPLEVIRATNLDYPRPDLSKPGYVGGGCMSKDPYIMISCVRQRPPFLVGRAPHQRAFARDSGTDRAAVQDAIARTGCERLAGRSFSTLSGGEKQRVLIARALAQGADHLILDEPTSQLDIRYQVEIMELAARLGVTVLAALHDLSLAAMFCDTVHLITDGRLAASGSARTVLAPETIRQAYGADVLVIEHPDTGTPHLVPRRERGEGGITATDPPCPPAHAV